MTNINNTLAAISLPLNYSSSLLTGKEKRLIGASGNLAVFRPEFYDPSMGHRTITVGVHSGEFHGDEVLAVLLLQHLLPYKTVEVVRSRDNEVLASCDLRIDVGEGLLDHHGSRSSEYSSAVTRVWQLLRQTFRHDKVCFKYFQGKSSWYNHIDQLVADVAATDLGLQKPNWIGEMVNAYSCESSLDYLDGGEDTSDSCFSAAVKSVDRILSRYLEYWMAEAEAEAKAIQEIKSAGPNAKVVVFSKESRVANVKWLLYKHAPHCRYYVSPEGEEDYRVLCAADPAQEFSLFSSRELIPAEFRGLRGEELSKKSHIPGGIFCHAAGFIAGFRTERSATDFAIVCSNLIDSKNSAEAQKGE